jgi:YfiH family protein
MVPALKCWRSRSLPAISFRLARDSVQRQAVAAFICSHPFTRLTTVSVKLTRAISRFGISGLALNRGVWKGTNVVNVLAVTVQVDTLGGDRVFHSKLLGQVRGVSHAFEPVQKEAPQQVVLLKQVHGANTLEVTDAPGMVGQEGDGLITVVQLAIGVRTADCVPLLIADTDGRMVSAVHAGWQGLVMGVIASAIYAFGRRGVSPETLVVGIGPCIRECCYEVGIDVASRFDEAFSRQEPCEDAIARQFAGSSTPRGKGRAPRRNGGRMLNLVAVAKWQLLQLGIAEDRIDVVGECTYCGTESLESYRRAKHEGRKLRGVQHSWIKRNSGAQNR